MDLLTREDVAKQLGLSTRQVDRLIASGQIRAVRLGAAVRIRTYDLEEYMHDLAHPISIGDAALLLAIHPDSVRSLVGAGDIPFVRRGTELLFHKKALEEWKRSLFTEPIIFGNMDHEAEEVRDALAGRGHAIRLLYCALCESEVQSGAKASAFVAGERCHLCRRVTCLPHALHYLTTGLGPNKPPVACDDCFDRFHPETISGGRPRKHRLAGHTSRGECLLCSDGCPRPCTKPGCRGVVHADGGSPFVAAGEAGAVSHGPACDTCGGPG